MNKHIAFITYETPFAPGGGIAAVMAHLPKAVQFASQIPTFVITPFHFNIDRTTRLEQEMKTIATVEFIFQSSLCKVQVKILQEEISWVFLKPVEQAAHVYPFFAGKSHPYEVPTGGSDYQSILLRDALLFGIAAEAAMSEICRDCKWTVLLQDWEAVTCVYPNAKYKTKNSNQTFYLTLHNSYDYGVNQKILSDAGGMKFPYKGDTVLEFALPLLEDPIFTVSEQFAIDLSSELFQSKIMIPHLVNQLEPRLFGINNGPFTDLKIPEDVYQAGVSGNFRLLSDWKNSKRSHALSIIREFTPRDEAPVWGDIKKFAESDLPWFVMAGRDDTRQKGYEIACLAIEEFLQNGNQACFIFFPIPGDEGMNGIQFINDLSDKYPSHVLCFPFIFREGYFPIMQGASFGMMPSYYEPFGMANEFFLNGLSCIGRATGGIVQQIVPNRDALSFTRAVSNKSDRWHLQGAPPTGFLFREDNRIKSALDDWQAINAADYAIDEPGKNRLEKRQELNLVRSMVTEMKDCLEDAAGLYISDHEKYLKFIIDGISFIKGNFSWEYSAKKYLEKLPE